MLRNVFAHTIGENIALRLDSVAIIIIIQAEVCIILVSLYISQVLIN